MSDYIKREDAIKALEGWKISGEMILATVPSADVVEVDKAQKEIDYWHDKAQSYEQTILKLSLNKADVVEVVRKPIKGYEGHYEVDQFGRVYSVDRIVHVNDNGREYDKPLKGKRMKQSVHTKGYKTVPLTKDGKTTTHYVHRLVAEAFIPNPSNLPFINHKDEDKTNNFVENLEWCTEQYNATYGKAREKQAKKLRGRKHSEEHKQKISEGVKHYHCSYGERADT